MRFLQDLLRFHRGELAVEPDWRALEAILGATLAADASDWEFDSALKRAVANYYRLGVSDVATLQRLRNVQNWILSQRTVADAGDMTAPRRAAERVYAYAVRQNRPKDSQNR